MNVKNLFSEFNSKKILVIGDSMIDSYLFGEINRTSPEAPVPVVETKKHESRLGGAANVALNLKSLGATPILCSAIGDDKEGKLFIELMKKEDLTTEGMIISKIKRTTLKTRVIANDKHQLRIDEEDSSPIDNEIELIDLIKKLIYNIDVVVLQDYNKGVLTSNVINEVIKIANNNNIPSIVDPKKDNFFNYKNCTIFKPNLAEIKIGMNINDELRNLKDLNKVTTKLRLQLNSDAVLLTLSSRGICLDSHNNFHQFPSYKRKLVDVSGAGDTVISVAALCLSTNINYSDLTILSNLAGGLVCEAVGVIPINKEKFLNEAIKTLKNE
ncbi:MAG: D-glycero-beta-D-manno-heptose-7-phosphate kinase [Flavobacteriales bacterium]|nr:D-glycero-beta-D-manno-heptose-7-phosphate kinase [Flavobacteriales bacterium]